MILPDFKDFPRYGRIVGIDWGARRIGLAVSDESREFVFPRQIVNRASEIINFMQSEKIVGIVIGLPLHADYSDSGTTRMVRKFATDLANETDLPIAFIEENLTSVEAEERLGNRKDIDSESAAIILENAIAIMKRSN